MWPLVIGEVCLHPTLVLSLEFDMESVGANGGLCTDREDFNKLGVSKSTSSEFI